MVQSSGNASDFRAIQYDSQKHLSVIFKWQGSIWPQVLPYCIVNVIVLYLKSWYLDPIWEEHGIVVTKYSHTMSVFIVSFFVISRSSMTLKVYNSAQTNLGTMLSNTRTLVSCAAIDTKVDQSISAKEWRNEVAYYSCLLLKICITVITKERLPWELPELSGKIKQQLMEQNSYTGDTRQLCDHLRTKWVEAHRTPSTMSYFLRILLMDEDKRVSEKILNPSTIARCNGLTDALMHGYHAQFRLAMLGFAPFPIIQMARTMMFAWVFTLPFCMQSDPSSLCAHAVIVFFLTYSFIGLETISCQLEDPFDGEDECDLDALGMAEFILEDVYNIIDIVDGPEWAKKVRMKMSEKKSDEGPVEKTPLLDA